jgi:hypothetical protein
MNNQTLHDNHIEEKKHKKKGKPLWLHMQKGIPDTKRRG